MSTTPGGTKRQKGRHQEWRAMPLLYGLGRFCLLVCQPFAKLRPLFRLVSDPSEGSSSAGGLAARNSFGLLVCEDLISVRPPFMATAAAAGPSVLLLPFLLPTVAAKPQLANPRSRLWLFGPSP